MDGCKVTGEQTNRLTVHSYLVPLIPFLFDFKPLCLKHLHAVNLIGQKVNRLEINWIKAHVGHIGNELADKMAREAVHQTENTHWLFLPIAILSMNSGKLCITFGK